MRLKAKNLLVFLVIVIVYIFWKIYVQNVIPKVPRLTNCEKLPCRTTQRLDKTFVSSLKSNVDKEILLGIIRNSNDEKLRVEGYEKHAFNELISNRIGYYRTIPDTRHQMCKSLTYSSGLPSASVIICFHNEAWSTLLRTIHSVLDRTPSHLLHDIILVDDFSTHDVLKEKLRDYIKDFDKVYLFNTAKREGLIRCRSFGASKAMGDVLIFLDSHCEVNRNWLPPLLQPILNDSTTVVCPLIDIINSDTFQYISSPLVKGGFNWGLHFQWEPLATEFKDTVKPLRSATMSGGLFGIDRRYFNKIGKYDDGMNIWGGENLELSFRIWMCGGQLVFVPCSRVGHVFRDRRPYGGDKQGDTMSYNSMRLAEVWLDEYKEHFYNVRSHLKGTDFGDVSERRKIRKKLKCRSFKWYLYNIYPEIDIPSERRGSSLLWQRSSFGNEKPLLLKQGKLGNAMAMCIIAADVALKKGVSIILSRCNNTFKGTWFYNNLDQLLFRDKYCLDLSIKGNLKLMKCHGSGNSQEWKYFEDDNIFYNPGSGKCLSHSKSNKIIIEICGVANERQKWLFF